MENQTAAQKIRDFFKHHSRMPSYKEMCHLFGVASKRTCFRIAQKLIHAGLLEKDSTGKLIPKLLFSALPYVGSIKAGIPTPAEQELLHTMSFDSYLVNKPHNSFILKVSGDSMIEAGILPGDLVVIEKDKQARDGDIVVAYVDQEWTLKYYRNINGAVCLMPANGKYPPIYPRESLTIWGKVVSVIRKLS